LSASPALDLTYQVDELSVGGTNRVRAVTERPGGKAVNVARLLHLLGTDVHVLTTAGGDTGVGLGAGLAELGIPHTLFPTERPTRRTTAIVEQVSGAVTMFSEPAAIEDWSGYVARCDALIALADVVVISGSIPAGAPVDGFAQLTAMARSHGRPVILDSSGPALAAALDAGPTVIKPNAEELRELVDDADPLAAVRSVAERWDVAVVASLGSDGLLAATADGCWHARPRMALTGNATGAGDAVVAGIARGVLARTAWPELLADCVGLASAAVLSPCAGELDLLDYQRELAGVSVVAAESMAR
jgi:tagatose 6-phosphate kinase